MNLDGILPYARILLEKCIEPGDIAIDGTIGNGNDTVFLAKLVGPSGHVFGFDIQQQALDSTRKKLDEHAIIDRVTLFGEGHEKAADLIPDSYSGKIAGAIFNLGYLPKGDKSIVTRPHTTIAAIEQILVLLKKGGIIVLVIYHGHEEGAIEKNHLLDYVENLDQTKVHVLRYEFINQKNNPPFIIALEKR